ncbi:hypothetical protein PITCH_A1660002 [uncultured Desulfobacterium sp.]|uniref:Uncharacterized protein n=1 Tax=uncultured Desulfobacterium sp. TaxID=201089 RepID=A0A445MU62_9BACT|nr:hypothetical protein PITCH_A1660002 [uncultured Desulfobacterium sp.]
MVPWKEVWNYADHVQYNPVEQRDVLSKFNGKSNKEFLPLNTAELHVPRDEGHGVSP